MDAVYGRAPPCAEDLRGSADYGRGLREAAVGTPGGAVYRRSMTGIRIVLADDHAVVRAGLRRVLNAQDGWRVVAEAGTAAEAVRLSKLHRPEVLVLDLAMPGGSSLEAIPGLAATLPATRVVVLTMEDDPAFARRALSGGARAYVLKEAADEELVAAIRAALAGGTHLTPRLGGELAAGSADASGPTHDLTAREAEILRLIAEGHTNTEIARRLFLSVRTVEAHRAHIQRKVGAGSRSKLVRYALEHGLLDAAGSGAGRSWPTGA